MAASLPTLLYHYVNPHKDAICVPPQRFAAHLSAMARAGWQGVPLARAEAFLNHSEPLPKKAALITFDDGFLDNYAFAFPLLKKFSHQAVIFTVTDMIEHVGGVAPHTPHQGDNPPGPISGEAEDTGTKDLLRPTLEDVWENKLSEQELTEMLGAPHAQDDLGFRDRRDRFFSWAEARHMEASGVITIAAHSARHESVYSGPDFENIVTPGPRKRTFDRVSGPMLYGMPRFGHAPALAQPAFVPSEKLLDLVRSLAPQGRNEAHAFFQQPGKAEEIQSALAELTPAQRGEYESTPEFQARVRAELESCKQTLERELGREETTLAWPWGKYSPESLAIAQDLGFTTFFCTTNGPNLPGQGSTHIHRFKARDRSAAWLRTRLAIWSRPWLARAYASIK